MSDDAVAFDIALARAQLLLTEVQAEVAEVTRLAGIQRDAAAEAEATCGWSDKYCKFGVPSDDLAAARAEVERLRLTQFAPPLGDNHHNAEVCPYCAPRRDKALRDAGVQALTDAADEVDAPVTAMYASEFERQTWQIARHEIANEVRAIAARRAARLADEGKPAAEG